MDAFETKKVNTYYTKVQNENFFIGTMTDDFFCFLRLSHSF